MQEKTLHTSFNKDPATMDPRKSGDLVSSTVIFLLFKGLTRLEANHEITLDLAESYHISDNGKCYLFNLGEHYWNNGNPITAFDIEHSWKTVLSPEFPSLSAHLFYPIKNARKAKEGKVSLSKIGVIAKGPKTLIVKLENPTPYFLELVSFCTFFPIAHGTERQFCAKTKNFICSSPFELQHYRPKSELVLKRNLISQQKYRISLNKIVIRVIPDAKLAFSLLKKGKLDWLGDPLSPLPFNHLPAISTHWKTKPIAGVNLCFFNTQQLPFSSLPLRKAFSQAIQRNRLLEKLNIPNAKVAERFIPPFLKTIHPSILSSPTDLETIRDQFTKEMQKLSLRPEDLPLTLTFEASEIWYQIAKNLQKDWQDIFSVRVNLEPLEFKAFYDRLSRRQYTFALVRWMSQYISPMNILERFKDLHSGKNFSGWFNHKYNALLKKYMFSSNEKNRLDIARSAEDILLEHVPAAPLYHFSYSYFQNPWIKNLLYSPIGRVYLEQVDIDSNELDITNHFSMKNEKVPSYI